MGGGCKIFTAQEFHWISLILEMIQNANDKEIKEDRGKTHKLRERERERESVRDISNVL